MHFGPELPKIRKMLRIRLQKCENDGRTLAYFFPREAEFLNTKRCKRVQILLDLAKSFQTSSYYLLAKFGVDTAENELLKVCQELAKS